MSILGRLSVPRLQVITVTEWAVLGVDARGRVLMRVFLELLLGEELLERPAVAVGLGEAVDLSRVRVIR